MSTRRCRGRVSSGELEGDGKEVKPRNVKVVEIEGRWVEMGLCIIL